MKIVLKNTNLEFQTKKVEVLSLTQESLEDAKYLNASGTGYNTSNGNCATAITSLNGATTLSFKIRSAVESSWKYGSAMAFYSSDSMSNPIKVVPLSELFSSAEADTWKEIVGYPVPSGATHFVISNMTTSKGGATPFYVKGWQLYSNYGS